MQRQETRQTYRSAWNYLAQMLTDKKPFSELSGTHAAIIIYWSKVLEGISVKDYFAIPEANQRQESQVNLHRLFRPMVTECRTIKPESRPKAQQLVMRIGNV